MQKDYTKIDEETLKKIRHQFFADKEGNIEHCEWTITELMDYIEKSCNKAISLSEQSLLERVESKVIFQTVANYYYFFQSLNLIFINLLH
jgi:hypothetical protein